jgi:hypothetical protein
MRSVGELYLHVAIANFSVGRNFGMALPGNINLSNYEKSVSSKAEILKRLRESFAYYRQVITKLNVADANKPIRIFAHTKTLQAGLGMTLDHVSVHLRQSLACMRISQELSPGNGSNSSDSSVRLRAILPRAKTWATPVPPALKINVLVYDFANVPSDTLSKAEGIAARAFQQAGIEPVWMDCTCGPPQSARVQSCAARVGGSLYLELRILPRMVAQMDSQDNTIGAALHTPDVGVFDTVAMIFFDHVERLSLEMALDSRSEILAGVGWQNAWKEMLLGASMAHELGHLLLGTSHTRDGSIMMPSFRREDLILVLDGSTRFNPHQAVQLRNEVVVRALTDLGFQCPYQARLNTK